MYSSLKRLRVRGRRAAAIAAAGAVAIVAAGCASFVSPPTGSQLAPNGDVTITSNICLFSFVPGFAAYDVSDGSSYGDGVFGDTPPNCDNTYQPVISDFDESGQLLLAYEIPVGSKPGAVTSPELPGTTFTRNSDYATWLDANGPTIPTGYEWVGYMSSPFTVSGGLNLRATAEFTPPASPAGNPNTSPYAVDTVVVGDRLDSESGFDFEDSPDTAKTADGSPSDFPPPTYFPSEPVAPESLDPNRPLDCDAFDVTSTDRSDFGRVAPDVSSDVSSEDPTDCVEDYTTSPTDITTRSLTSTAPAAAVTVQAGNTATIPFTVQYNGPSASPFMLSASTSSNALVAVPANGSFTPSGTGNTVENVTVPTPAGLTPGNYTVTLNVGAFGSTPATLTVTPPPTTTTTTGTTTTTTTPVTPQQTPTISGLDVASNSLKLTLTLNVAATERLTLARRKGSKWSTLKTLSVKGSAGNNTLHLKSLFGSLLNPAGRYRISVQAFNGSLSSAVQSLTFVVS
jgi:hypothetical protein